MELTRKILDFIDYDEIKFICFSHRTNSEEIARKIMEEGFEFAEAIQSTTDFLVNDEVVLKYYYNLRRNYGEYNIIICIANEVYDYYLGQLKNSPNGKMYTVEELLTEREPRYDEERDQTIFLLPKQFIKGFYNEETAEITKNPDFDPNYNSDKFKENLEKIIHPK
ncbi:hypothetical protein ACFLTE_05150 [Bacteroidota bacterium]